MSLRLYDSAAKSVRDFVPLEPGKAGIYLCGATVQGAPHVGHVRSGIAFDILRRWLSRSGFEVTFVRNVTDIDDKILAKSAEAGAPWWAWAYRFEREFAAAYDALGVIPPTYEPRATGHITEMIELMERLVARGHAYAGDEGNVYFDVRSLPGYGALTRQSLDALLSDTEVSEHEPDKRDPRDFALWKRPRAGEPDSAAWVTPFGRGRPGWHLECSAMAHRYLGESFDIHGGGIELRFPHHENEIAQSTAAGDGFARYWLHNAWVTASGEKMSKSLGNVHAVTAVTQRWPAAVVRYALGTVHYRSTVEFTEAALAETAATWERLVGFVERASERVGEAGGDEVVAATLPAAFAEAMDDDLNISAALAVVHERLRAGNTALSEGRDDDVAAAALQVRAMLDVLGLDPLSSQWRGSRGGADSAVYDALDALVVDVLAQRDAARAAKDWARADALRDQLTAAGIHVEDSAEGARWHVKGTN